MSSIATQIAELESAIETTKPILEGFRDLNRVLTEQDEPSAQREVEEAVRDYEKRMANLTSSLSALKALQTNGYPARVPVVLSEDAAAILRDQVRTQTLAVAELTVPVEAQSVEISVTGISTP